MNFVPEIILTSSLVIIDFGPRVIKYYTKKPQKNVTAVSVLIQCFSFFIMFSIFYKIFLGDGRDNKVLFNILILIHIIFFVINIFLLYKTLRYNNKISEKYVSFTTGFLVVDFFWTFVKAFLFSRVIFIQLKGNETYDYHLMDADIISETNE